MKNPEQVAVLFATPALNSSVCTEYLRSMTETIWALGKAGISSYGFIQRNGDCFVSKARNKLATEFLVDWPAATDFFFLDDDIGWPADKVIEFLDRPEPVIAGVYPKKSNDLDFPVMVDVNPTTGLITERDGLVKALLVPTGFLRIKRHVLQALANKARMFRDQEIGGKSREYYYIFEDGPGDDGWWWGEDSTFCRKWMDMGGELWVDPDIKFTHRGHNKWTETLKDHMQVFRDKAAAAVKQAA